MSCSSSRFYVLSPIFGSLVLNNFYRALDFEKRKTETPESGINKSGRPHSHSRAAVINSSSRENPIRELRWKVVCFANNKAIIHSTRGICILWCFRREIDIAEVHRAVAEFEFPKNIIIDFSYRHNRSSTLRALNVSSQILLILQLTGFFICWLAAVARRACSLATTSIMFIILFYGVREH